MLEGLGMQVFCTQPVAGPAESMKNKTELWHFFASFLFAFNVEKDETLWKVHWKSNKNHWKSLSWEALGGLGKGLGGSGGHLEPESWKIIDLLPRLGPSKKVKNSHVEVLDAFLWIYIWFFDVFLSTLLAIVFLKGFNIEKAHFLRGRNTKNRRQYSVFEGFLIFPKK